MGELTSLLQWGPDGWGDELAAGLQVTILLALATAPVGLIGGLLLALARRSASWPLRVFGEAFATIFKGLPELLTLFLVYHGVALLVQQLVALFSDTYVELNGFVAGMIALGAVSASYASEVFMAALGGIPKGQYEAAQTLGLGRWATMRKVILPQILRLAFPGLGNLWLVLLKDTALVSVIALPDLLRRTTIAVGATKEPMFFFAVALVIYFVVSLISMAFIYAGERRMQRGFLGMTK